MASPFSVFRRNQKLMFAVLGVMVMFAFVFLPLLGDNLGLRGSAPKNPVVVETSQFGDLKESDLQTLLQNHRRILDVLANIGQMAGQYATMAQYRAESVFGHTSEQQVVDTWLLANHARQLGMVVSDETVNAFLKEWSRDAVKPADLAGVMKRAGLSTMMFFNLMRDELMARQIREMFLVSLGGVTPAERWEYFKRINRMAGIETAAVPVANYVNRIDEPSNEELVAFFEKHKDQYSTPASPEPGFREPQKISLQWFKADQEKFLSAVTDAEIEERYQKNKDVYQEFEKKMKEAAEKQKAEAAPSADAAKTENVEKKEEAAPPQATEPPAANAPEKKEEPKEEPKDSSSLKRPSPFRLVSMLEETPKAAEEKPAEEQKPADAQEKSAEEPKPAETQEKPAEEPKPAESQEKPAEKQEGMAETTRNRIRREIANERIMRIFENLRKDMDQFRNMWSKYEVSAIQAKSQKNGEQQSLPPEPPKLNFEKLAEQNGLQTGLTDLIPQWQAQSTQIGTSLVGGRVPVWQYAYQGLSKFRAEMSLDMQGNLYLLWKTDETKDHIPKFDDAGVRDQVLQAWKMEHARDLAVKEAESLQAEAEKSKKTLKELLADRPDMPVVAPPAFSWITFGNVPLGSAPEAARLSNVEGVEYAGEDFMRTVFNLLPGQLGVAMNAPKTAAYLIQVNEFTPSHQVLWKEFEVDDFSKYAPASTSEQRQVLSAWLDELKHSAGFEWKRKADQIAERAAPSE